MNMAVEIVQLSKNFQKQQILKKISHSFEEGKIHGIIGLNGSGKTVLFKCICGFLNPDGGYVKVFGKRIGKDMDFPADLGMIIENPGFLPQFSGYENLIRLADLRKKIGKQEIIESMIRVGLDPLSKKKVGQYSLGMRERLGIAQAIMEDPKLLILDEPFNGLDKKGAEEVCALLVELRDQGKTILLAAHNLPNMNVLCDTVCEMDAGVLTQVVREQRS